MAEAATTAAPQDAAPKKPSKLPLLLGLFGALALGSGGFYVAWSGLLGGSHGPEAAAESPAAIGTGRIHHPVEGDR